jgi:hypothetical protein
MGLYARIGPIEASALINPAVKPRLDAIVAEAERRVGPASEDVDALFDGAIGVVVVLANGKEFELQSSSFGCFAFMFAPVAAFAVSSLSPVLSVSRPTLFVATILTFCMPMVIARVVSRIRRGDRQALHDISGVPDLLTKLQLFTRRNVQRLRRVHTLQLLLAVIVFAILAAFIAWALYMVTQSRLSYAALFGGAGLAGAVLTRILWDPFRRAKEALLVANSLDAQLIGLVAQMRAVEVVVDPEKRARAQAEVVLQYTKGLREV